MKNSINLVSKRRTPNKFHRQFFIVSLIFFSITFLASAGIIAYQIVLSTQLSDLKAEESALIARVNSNPEKKIKFLTVRERLSEIQKIISKRKNVNSRIESISEAIPFDVGINQVEGDEDELKVRVAADDLSSLNSLIEEKIEEYATEDNRGIKRVEMSSFSLNPNSLQYEATFTIEFI